MRKLRKVVNHVEDELDRRTEPSRQPHDRAGADPEHRAAPSTGRTREADTSETVTPPMTRSQWRGAVLGGLAGGIIGALLLLPIAFTGLLDAVPLRVLVVAIIGGIAGATAGAVYWGGRMPEMRGETTDADGRPSVGTSLRDPDTDERGR
jgi:hypothetical protein